MVVPFRVLTHRTSTDVALKRNSVAIDTACAIAVKVLVRDRFCDFSGDVVVAPVRAALAMVVGCLARA